MVTVYDVKAEPLIMEAAEDLEEEFDAPEWTNLVKTGSDRERPPEQENWYHIRSAAILRKIYTDGPLGVSRLRTVYGKRKDNGHGPEHQGKASGKVIRTALQNLEEAGLVETEEGEGRVITEEGQAFLDEKSEEVY
ncbi:30S ribosomal protein S19e [Candidatus Nanohalobium constans]|uniref:Small ribosomal subunit protein eS19 n=1 Tax=Candidatus Nanohalobium constans TaxID=2565781 RepID=A0A5Q0UG07_9ARCH|nr:30S ribosomal protein S19e [Candidatus Nanohalobium constans]QGA80140.1 30S ribosomal protein S19e [Candidatus Nanohalobium constans]